MQNVSDGFVLPMSEGSSRPQPAAQVKIAPADRARSNPCRSRPMRAARPARRSPFGILNCMHVLHVQAAFIFDESQPLYMRDALFLEAEKRSGRSRERASKKANRNHHQRNMMCINKYTLVSLVNCCRFLFGD
jgi:hypothetical protein